MLEAQSARALFAHSRVGAATFCAVAPTCTAVRESHNAKFYSRFINAVAERLQAILPTVHAQHPIAPTKTTDPELLGVAASHRADRADLDGCPESREVVPISDLKELTSQHHRGIVGWFTPQLHSAPTHHNGPLLAVALLGVVR